jgi:RNA polymerase sigma-70 factor (ECF subfamily)
MKEAAAAEPDIVLPAKLYAQDVSRALERLVIKLPPKERACGLLKDVFGYSLDEIADLVVAPLLALRQLCTGAEQRLPLFQTSPHK